MTVVGRSVGAALVVASLALSAPAIASTTPVRHAPVKFAPARSTPAKTYRGAMKSIDITFARAVAQATRSLHAQMARAKTAADRINARNQYRIAIVHATQRREVEVEVLDSSPLGQNNPDNPVTTTTAPNAGSSGSGDH